MDSSANGEFGIVSANPGGEPGMGGGRRRYRYGGKYNFIHAAKSVGNALKSGVTPPKMGGGKGTYRRKHKRTRKSRKHRKKTHRRY